MQDFCQLRLRLRLLICFCFAAWKIETNTFLKLEQSVWVQTNAFSMNFESSGTHLWPKEFRWFCGSTPRQPPKDVQRFDLYTPSLLRFTEMLQKSKRNNICHPTSYRATLAIPVRISGWTIRFVFNLSRYGL